MEPKKNPNKDLDKHRGLFFVLGLAFMLFLAYMALEWKTYNRSPLDLGKWEHIDAIDEEVPPMIQVKLPPPPPPPIAPDMIELVPDDAPREETVITSTEGDQNMEILEVSDVVFEELEEDIPIPISVVDVVPVFPGCEQEADKRACFNKMMLRHVQKTFRYPEISQKMGVQGKVFMTFVIQKDGSIGEIKVLRSPDRNLEREAARIIGELPQMRPGKQAGKPVRVPFSIPISFTLQ